MSELEDLEFKLEKTEEALEKMRVQRDKHKARGDKFFSILKKLDTIIGRVL